MHQLSRLGTVGLSVWGTFICVVGLVGLLSAGKAEAKRKGPLQCWEELATCQTDLDACEAEPNVVFPGDGQVGLDHGPALSYTDNGDGTFTDNNTQLMWEKKDTVLGSVHNVNNLYQWGLFSPDGSLFTTFLATLNTAPCFAGHCDWWIPTIKELQSIVDYSKAAQLNQPMTSVPGETANTEEITETLVIPGYWSRTKFIDSPSGAWGVNFGDGSVFPGVISYYGQARAVQRGL